jgi:Xaa-Pro dipeptidase
VVSDTGRRLAAELPELGATWALLSSPDAVGYVSGRPVPIEAGPSPFLGGPTLALVDDGGRCVLVAPNLEAGPSLADDEVSYIGSSAADAEDLPANHGRAVEATLEILSATGPVAIEWGSLPHAVGRLLEARGIQLVDVAPGLARARMIKTPRELELLRASGRIAAAAQIEARRAAVEGVTELEVFARLRTHAEALAGERLPFTGDLVSGPERTAAVGGWPGARRLQVGDLVIADLAPRVAGYWADSCSTFTVGPPSDVERRMFDHVHDALTEAERIARPGIPVSRIDAGVRRRLSDAGMSYPHHTGHGIGTAVHEFPRIIPGEHTLLQPGMVILLEPGAYLPGVGGVRLERMYLVGDDGVESLTDFPMHL